MATIPQTCPYCGKSVKDGYEIYSKEWIPGRATILIRADGTADWSGGTDLNWYGQFSEDYYTACCDTLIDDSELAFALDDALRNRRYDVSIL